MIPDEAVEAAAEALYELERGVAGWRPFIEMPAQHVEEWREQARAALKAAAPHITAQALEQAAEFVTSPRAKPVGADLARSDAVRNWLRKRAAHIREGAWDRSVTW